MSLRWGSANDMVRTLGMSCLTSLSRHCDERNPVMKSTLATITGFAGSNLVFHNLPNRLAIDTSSQEILHSKLQSHLPAFTRFYVPSSHDLFLSLYTLLIHFQWIGLILRYIIIIFFPPLHQHLQCLNFIEKLWIKF